MDPRSRLEIGLVGIALATGLGFAAVPGARAAGAPSLSLHAVESPVASCVALDLAGVGCDDLVVDVPDATDLLVFVLATHVDSLAGVQFGIHYDATVSVNSWTRCTSGLDIPEDGWPDSGTAIALAFPEILPTGPDSLVALGFFTIEGGSSGSIQVTDDARIGEAVWSTGGAVQRAFPVGLLGSVAIDEPFRGGHAPCGDSEIELVTATGISYLGGDGTFYPAWIAAIAPDARPLGIGLVRTDEANDAGYDRWVAASFARPGTGGRSGYVTVRVSPFGERLVGHSYGAEAIEPGSHSRTGQETMGTGPNGMLAAHVGTVPGPGGSSEGLVLWTNETAAVQRATAIDGAGAVSLHAVTPTDDPRDVLAVGVHRVTTTPTDPGRFGLSVVDVVDGIEATERYDALPEIDLVLGAERFDAGGTDAVVVLGRGAGGDALHVVRVDDPRSSLTPTWHAALEVDEDTLRGAALAVDRSAGRVGEVVVAAATDAATDSARVRVWRVAADGASAVEIAVTAEGAGTTEVTDVVVGSDGSAYVGGRMHDRGHVVRIPAGASDWTEIDWDHEIPDGGVAPGLIRDLALDVEEGCLYLVGEGDDPDDASDVAQLYVGAVAADAGSAGAPTVGGSVYVRPEDFPTDSLNVGGSGAAILTATDPTGFEELPLAGTPLLYLLGEARAFQGGSVGLVMRHPTGGCVDASVGVVTAGVPGAGHLRVVGGRRLEVRLAVGASSTVPVQVYDVAGRQVRATRIEMGATEVRFDRLLPGVYFVVAEVGDARLRGRGVVVR